MDLAKLKMDNNKHQIFLVNLTVLIQIRKLI
jgi:hypothetical protein